MKLFFSAVMLLCCLFMQSLLGWTTPERLTTLASFSELSENNARNIVFDNQRRIHVIWASYCPVPGFTSVPQIWYKRYEPNSGWTRDTCIADVFDETSEFPSLCVDSSDNLHLVYLAYTYLYHIRYKTWNPATGWQSSVIISTGTGDKQNPPSCAATPDGHIHVVWDELYNGYYEIFYREKVSGVWQTPLKISDTTNMTDKGAATVAGGRDNNVYCAWKGENPVSDWTHIYYRSRTGGVWGAITNVTGVFYSDQCDGVGIPYGPSLAVDNSNVVHIVWYGGEQWDNYYYRVYYRRRHPTSGWLTIDTIAGANQPDDLDRFAPQILIDRQQNARVVWYGEDYWTDGWLRLWHKKRTPGGWLATEELACEYPEGDLYNPHIANDSLGLHLIWFDDRLEDEEIFRVVSYPRDLEVKTITSPLVFCSLANYQPKVIVKNSGEEEILNAFDIKMKIEPGGYENIQTLPGLGPGEEETLNFTLWQPNQPNLYSVKCSLLFSDMFSLNNKKEIYCGIPNFIEDFESSNGGFLSDPATNAWEWGTPSGVGAPIPYSGTKCFGTNIDGNYSNNANWKLNSLWYIATRDTPVLGFYHWYNLDPSHKDGGNIKITKDLVNYTVLTPLFGRYDRKLTNENAGIPQESAFAMDRPTGWKPALFKIPVRTGDTFQIRWHFGSDGNTNDLGWYLDYEGGIGFSKIWEDVGVLAISSPPDTCDSSITIIPSARLRNLGNRNASFSATMKIGSYTDTKTVFLSANQESTITFNPWTPQNRGFSLARCSLYLTGDRNRANDTLMKTFFIRVKDVGVLDIAERKSEEVIDLAVKKLVNGNNEFQLKELSFSSQSSLPLQLSNSFTLFPDTIDSGDVYTPRARIKNFGNTSTTFYAKFTFGNIYTESLPQTLLPDSEVSFNFRPFSAQGRGLIVRTCTTMLAGDLVPNNNYKRETTFIRVRDVGTFKICSPVGVIDSGVEVTPACSVGNFGNTTESYSVRFKIGTFYNQTLVVNNHQPGTYLYLTFPNWTAHQVGIHIVSCSTELATDRQRLNDRRIDTVIVRPPFFRDVGCIKIIQPSGIIDSGRIITPACSVYNYGTTIETYLVRMKIGNFYNQTASISSHSPGASRYLTFPNWTSTLRGNFPVSC
ncbi:MAG: hypothetical protein ABIK81_02710, partial [candidate division WOR-3 bacterium]